MMKVKEGFMLREVAGSYAVVPVGKASLSFKGMISLNETGAFLFKLLKEGIEKEDLINKMLEEYDVTKEIATVHIEKFIQKLEESDIIE